MMRACVALLLLAAAGAAPAADRPVVTVNGEDLTLRELENELLQREGVERVLALVERHLKAVDWDALGDDEVLVHVPGLDVTRRQVAAVLLERDGPEVRTELLNIMLARQAIEAAGIVVDDELLERELERQRRRFAERVAAEGQAGMTFESYLQAREGVTLEQWMAEDGFRMAAGLHELVHRRSEIPLEVLKEHFAEHYDERFAERAAVRLTGIHIPFRTVTIDGRQVVDEGHRESLPEVMLMIHAQIASGQIDFATAWRSYGRAYDPQAVDGAIGWVARDGDPDNPGGRAIPAAVMEAAFAADLSDGPALLQPIVHETGVDLIRVEERRGERRPSFDEIRDRVRRDYVETHLDRLTKDLMKRIHREADIEYAEWAPLVRGRAGATAP